MKIIFKKLEIKNFLSYGNSITTLNLDSDPFTVIVGENGSGKSTLIIDAITFCLEGKIHRKGVLQEQIINNINKKNCLLELTFQKNTMEYKIKRGIKPNILELWNLTENTQFDSKSSNALLQIEIDNLIQIDIKTLKNICVLSLNNSKPFISLAPEERRNISETLFGIKIYSDILDEIKKQIKEIKDLQKINEKELTLYKELVVDGNEKVKKHEELLTNLKIEKNKKLEDLQLSSIQKNNIIEKLQKEYKNVIENFETNKEKNINEKSKDLHNLYSALKSEEESLEKKYEEFRINTQKIIDQLKDEIEIQSKELSLLDNKLKYPK